MGGLSGLTIFFAITHRRYHGHIQKQFFEFSKSDAAETGHGVPSGGSSEALGTTRLLSIATTTTTILSCVLIHENTMRDIYISE